MLILHINNTSVISRRYNRLLKGPIDKSSRVSILNKDLNNFNFENDKLCANNEITKKIFRRFLDINGCDEGDIEEIYSSLKGLRSKSSLKSRNSVINPEWVIPAKDK